MRTGRLLTTLLVAGAIAGLAFWGITEPRPIFSKGADTALDQDGDPTRGQLIFAAGDCASCHASPGQRDRLRLGGGLALASPFGTFRIPNISTDPVNNIDSSPSLDLPTALTTWLS